MVLRDSIVTVATQQRRNGREKEPFVFFFPYILGDIFCFSSLVFILHRHDICRHYLIACTLSHRIRAEVRLEDT